MGKLIYNLYMFWVPVVSILLFFAILIPTTILGYKKGWRSALFVSIILILINAIFAGIFLGIYKVALWPVYKSLFIEKHVHASGLDLDTFSSYYKSNIILVCLGLMMPFSYGSTILIYYFSKEKLNKYLGPRTKDVDKSEKNIIIRKNNKVAKWSGVGIMGITSLFSASFIASSLNVITTPYKKSNAFNKFNDTLAKIYTLGLGGNATEPQVITNFLNDINGSLADQIRNLIDFKFNEDSSENNRDFKDISSAMKYISDNKYIFDELFKYESASEAIFTSILKQLKDNKIIDVLGADKNTVISQEKDSNGNIIGFNRTGETEFIEEFEDFLKNNEMSFLNFPKPVRQVYLNTFLSMIEDFSNSIFAVNSKDVDIKIKNAIAEVARRKDDLSTRETTLPKQIQDRKDKDNEIFGLSGQKNTQGALETDAWQTLANSSSRGWDFSSVGNWTSGSQIRNLIEKIGDNGVGGSLQDLFNKAQDDERIKTSTFDNLDSQHTFMNNQRDAANKEIARLNSDNNRLNNDILNNKNKINSDNNWTQNWNNRRSSVGSKINTLTQQKQQKDNEIQQLISEITALDGKISNFETQIQTLRGQLATATTQASKDSINSQINSLTQQMNAAKTDKTSKESQKSSKERELAIINGNLSTSTNELQNNDSEKNNKDYEISSLNQQISDANSTINTNKQTIASDNQTLRDIANQWPQLDRDWKAAKNASDAAKAALKIADENLQKVKGDLQAMLQTYDQDIAAIDQLNKDITENFQDINFLKETNNIDVNQSLTANVNDFANLYPDTNQYGSIAWSEKYLQFLNGKKIQIDAIKSDKESVYNALKLRLVNSITNWLNL